jgi:hypothetical protein
MADKKETEEVGKSIAQQQLFLFLVLVCAVVGCFRPRYSQ